MKVKCISVYPNEEQLRSLGPNFYRRRGFGISVGTEYLVLGLTFEFNSSFNGTGPYADIQEDSGHLIRVPLCLFEVTDDRPSKYWRLKIWDDTTVTLRPPSFFAEYYDDLFEGVPEVVQDFNSMRQLMEAETTGNSGTEGT